MDLVEKLKFKTASKSITEVKIQCSIGEQIIKELNTRALTPEEAATVRGVLSEPNYFGISEYCVDCKMDMYNNKRNFVVL